MAAAALTISLVALVVAGASALFAWRQALVAEARDHRDRTPNLSLMVEPLPGDPTAGDLVVSHMDGPDLDRVEVEIVVPNEPPLEVPVPQFGPGNHSRSAQLEQLRQGENQRLRVTLNPVPPAVAAVFRLTC